MDLDLRDDMLKLVRYKVLFVRREYETAFAEQEEIVSDNMDADAFTAWKIAEFIQNLAQNQTPVPQRWKEKGYPDSEYVKDGYLHGIDEEDKKYLRVHFEVLERYPREKFKFEEQQIQVLEQIRDVLRLPLGGVADSGKKTPAGKPRVPACVRAGEGTKLDDAGNFTQKVSSEMSGGAYFIFEAVLPPGDGVQLHRHVNQDEVFYVLDGTFELQIGDDIYKVTKGDLGNLTKPVPHRMHNVGTTPAKALFTVVPGGLEVFFEQSRGMTDPKKIAALAKTFGMEFLGPQYHINTVGMNMVQLAPGAFSMGSPDSDQEANEDEKPLHKVSITNMFFLSMYTVTVGQFRMFINDTGYKTEFERNGRGSYGLDLTTGKVEQKPDYTWRSWLREDPQRPSGFQQTDSHPIVCVSWEDANAFCRWLSKRENKSYRLPTEAEWEYACRADSTTRYYSGDKEDSLEGVANIADVSLTEKWIWNGGPGPFQPGQHLPPYAKSWNDGYPFTAPVGRFRPNSYGFYDMHGNVGEWCSDWYDENYYKQAPAEDPQGPPVGEVVPIADRLPGMPPRTLRVIRGGVWLDPASGCRSADRQTHRRHPVDSAADIGFRVAMST
jgi:sulfatase modifying factor 1